MNTDDMAPEMLIIIKRLFEVDDVKEKWVKFEDIQKLLGLQNQETLYFVEELRRRQLISFHSSTGRGICYLTSQGRAYVMRVLRKKKD